MTAAHAVGAATIAALVALSALAWIHRQPTHLTRIPDPPAGVTR